MAKATRHGGASLTPEEQDGMEELSPRIRRPGIEPISRASKEEKPSAGDNSNPSSESQSTSDDNSNPSPPAPVPATVNPSEAPEQGDSSNAHSTGTRGQTNPRKRSGKAAAKAVDEDKPDDFSDF